MASSSLTAASKAIGSAATSGAWPGATGAGILLGMGLGPTVTATAACIAPPGVPDPPILLRSAIARRTHPRRPPGRRAHRPRERISGILGPLRAGGPP